MQYIEAPTVYEPKVGEKSIFLAGGITGCPNWQEEIAHLLSEANLVLLNPRRKNFSIDNDHVSSQQIRWEFDHLRKAKAILFWFPCETVCPITLYELGAWSMTDKPLYVGVHPNYQRKQDIEIQLNLIRPQVVITYSIFHLAKQIVNSQENSLNE